MSSKQAEARARITDLGLISDPRPMNLQREQHGEDKLQLVSLGPSLSLVIPELFIFF